MHKKTTPLLFFLVLIISSLFSIEGSRKKRTRARRKRIDLLAIMQKTCIGPSNREESVSKLIDSINNPRIVVRSASETTGNSALHHLAIGMYTYDTSPLITALLNRDPTLATCSNHKGQTPLHAAAYANNTPAIEAFSEAGINLDEPNSKGETPLMTAVMGCAMDSVQFLLSKEAGINAASRTKQTPLHYAVSGEFHKESARSKIIQLLLQNGAQISGDISLIRLYLSTDTKHSVAVLEALFGHYQARNENPKDWTGFLQTKTFNTDVRTYLAQKVFKK